MSAAVLPPLQREFPVLLHEHERRRYGVQHCPRAIAWAVMLPHERRALINHDQDLATLARRGGLDPTELVAVLEDRHWHMMPMRDAVDRLLELLRAVRA
jgi:hypothetical protein